MAEKMNRREAALNEAALEGVTNGSDALYAEMDRAARRFCESCRRAARICEGGSKAALREYMIAHGKIRVCQECPYYRDKR